MGDSREGFDMLNRIRVENRDRRRTESEAALRRAEIEWTEPSAGVFIIEREGLPKIQYWPGQGRWHVKGDPPKKIRKGGVGRFLSWLRKQEASQ